MAVTFRKLFSADRSRTFHSFLFFIGLLHSVAAMTSREKNELRSEPGANATNDRELQRQSCKDLQRREYSSE
jgi:hypothetical protein